MPSVSSTLWFMELVRTVTHNACTLSPHFNIHHLFYIATLALKSAVSNLFFC